MHEWTSWACFHELSRPYRDDEMISFSLRRHTCFAISLLDFMREFVLITFFSERGLVDMVSLVKLQRPVRARLSKEDPNLHEARPSPRRSFVPGSGPSEDGLFRHLSRYVMIHHCVIFASRLSWEKQETLVIVFVLRWLNSSRKLFLKADARIDFIMYIDSPQYDRFLNLTFRKPFSEVAN